MSTQDRRRRRKLRGTCMRVSGAAWTLLAVSAGTLAGILYIHEGQRQEREVRNRLSAEASSAYALC